MKIVGRKFQCTANQLPEFIMLTLYFCNIRVTGDDGVSFYSVQLSTENSQISQTQYKISSCSHDVQLSFLIISVCHICKVLQLPSCFGWWTGSTSSHYQPKVDPMLSHRLRHLHTHNQQTRTIPSLLWRCWLGGRKGMRPVKTERWVAGMVICLERGADLHMAQQMPLPLTVSCFSKIQIGFPFLVPAHPGSPGKGPLNGCAWLSCMHILLSI